MDLPFFSIIVGVYNVAAFLNKGVGNVLNQSFSSYELILVDDGSTDESSRLCDEWATKDERIKVIHKENGGLGSARNCGIDHAKGKYVCFYDVDDDVESNWLQVIYDNLEDDLEVLIFGLTEYSMRYKTVYTMPLKDVKVVDRKTLIDIYPEMLSGLRFSNGFVCNKVYLREFLLMNEIRFGSFRIQQDEMFNIEVYRKVTSLKIISQSLYRYYIYDTGNNRSKYIENRIDIYRGIYNAQMDVYKEFGLRNEELLLYYAKRLWSYVVITANFNYHHPSCPYSVPEKKEKILALVDYPEVQSALLCFSKNDFRQPLFLPRLYFIALTKKQYSLYTFTYIIDKLTQEVKLLLKS